MPLRSLITLPRPLRHAPSTGAGLPPDEAVPLDALAGPALGAALTAAAAGHHGPARAPPAATRRGAERERRSGCVSGVPVPAVSAIGSTWPTWSYEWFDSLAGPEVEPWMSHRDRVSRSVPLPYAKVCRFFLPPSDSSGWSSWLALEWTVCVTYEERARL
ncbi:hypothetical protein [Streptomyces sp. NRRL S-118]|uniref:hypothetical protein n=1 Tax=Streptomyces sp. NRRL S-118 TaxID=1463881 RepID=UPI000B07A884|nr:hypothetical protein [Streptomyces sp. NRRL S-118]